jgi:hypothetical protein
VGDHLTGGRRVPASREARGCLPVSSRRRGVHQTGAAPLPMGGLAALLQDDGGLRGGHRALFGDGPHQGDECPGDRHHDVVRRLPPCAQLSVACAEPYVRLPAAILSGCGALVQTAWPVATALRRRTVRPGACDACVSSLGVPRLGARALTPRLTTGGFRGGQAQVTHERSGVVNARQLPECCDEGDGDGQWPAPEGVKGLDHRLQTPGLHRLVACVFETSPACRVFVHRPDLCLADDWWRRGRTAHVREPAPRGRPPGGLARRADILPQPTRVQPELGGLEIPDGVFTRPAQIAAGVVFELWHRDGREVPRAHEPRQGYGVTPVGVDPVARLFRHQGRGDDPARIAFCTQVAREPRPARAGFVDQDQGLTFRLQLTDALSAVTLTRANGPERGALSTLLLSDLSHREGCLMDIQTAVACVRVWHG